MSPTEYHEKISNLLEGFLPIKPLGTPSGIYWCKNQSQKSWYAQVIKTQDNEKNKHSLWKTGMNKLKKMERVLSKHSWIPKEKKERTEQRQTTPYLILFEVYCINFQSFIQLLPVFKICLLHYHDFLLYARVQTDQSCLRAWRAAFSFAHRNYFLIM